MKSFSVIASLVIAISLACSSYKSASSPTPANSPGTANYAPTQTPGVITLEKTPCTLTLAGTPEIKGLRLGMTPDEVLALFPGSRDDAALRSTLSAPPTKFGISSFSIVPSKYESREKFTEISQIAFTLLDGRVSKAHVGFNGPQWPHVDNFVTKFIEGTNLPSSEQWTAYTGLDTQLKVLTCVDFEIRVFAGGQGGNLNYVEMHDLEADKKLKERRKKAREQASPTPANR